MSRGIYKVTRVFAFVMSFIVSIYFLIYGDIVRVGMNVILCGCFLYASYLFEKKYKIISVTYLFIFIVMYCVNSLASCYFTFEKIYELDKTGQNIGNQDYYSIYFWGIFLTYVVVIFYLKYLMSKGKAISIEIKQDKEEKVNLLIGCVVCLGLYYLTGKCAEFLYPIVAFLLLEILKDSKYRLYYFIMLCIMFGLFRNIFLIRFRFIQIVFPVFIMFLILNRNNAKKISMGKIYIIMLLFVVVGLGYGVISEVYKLKNQYGMDINLSVVMNSKELIWKYCMNQVYRVFVVWIKMGGYVIYEVKKRDIILV